jgi:PKD repeat protein
MRPVSAQTTKNRLHVDTRATISGVRNKLALILLASGLGAAVASMVAQPAHAWDVGSLPAGYSVSTIIDSSATDVAPLCHTTYHVQGFGGDFRDGTCDPDFQASLDAFVNATCPCAQTTTTAPETTTVGGSTQAAPTTTAATATATNPATATDPATAPGPAPVTTAALVPPTAAFTTQVVGQTVTLTDASKAANAGVGTISWHLGDGVNATGATLSHTYALAGVYTVIEIITDSQGLTDQATADVSVGAVTKAATRPGASVRATPSTTSGSVVVRYAAQTLRSARAHGMPAWKAALLARSAALNALYALAR